MFFGPHVFKSPALVDYLIVFFERLVAPEEPAPEAEEVGGDPQPQSQSEDDDVQGEDDSVGVLAQEARVRAEEEGPQAEEDSNGSQEASWQRPFHDFESAYFELINDAIADPDNHPSAVALCMNNARVAAFKLVLSPSQVRQSLYKYIEEEDGDQDQDMDEDEEEEVQEDKQVDEAEPVDEVEQVDNEAEQVEEHSTISSAFGEDKLASDEQISQGKETGIQPQEPRSDSEQENHGGSGSDVEDVEAREDQVEQARRNCVSTAPGDVSSLLGLDSPSVSQASPTPWRETETEHGLSDQKWSQESITLRAKGKRTLHTLTEDDEGGDRAGSHTGHSGSPVSTFANRSATDGTTSRVQAAAAREPPRKRPRLIDDSSEIGVDDEQSISMELDQNTLDMDPSPVPAPSSAAGTQLEPLMLSDDLAPQEQPGQTGQYKFPEYLDFLQDPVRVTEVQRCLEPGKWLSLTAILAAVAIFTSHRRGCYTLSAQHFCKEHESPHTEQLRARFFRDQPYDDRAVGNNGDDEQNSSTFALVLNVEENHWVAAWITMADRTATFYDSLPKASHEDDIRLQLTRFIDRILPVGFNDHQDWRIQQAQHWQQQINSADCGILTIAALSHLALGLPLESVPEPLDTTVWRRFLGRLIVHGDDDTTAKFKLRPNVDLDEVTRLTAHGLDQIRGSRDGLALTQTAIPAARQMSDLFADLGAQLQVFAETTRPYIVALLGRLVDLQSQDVFYEGKGPVGGQEVPQEKGEGEGKVMEEVQGLTKGRPRQTTLQKQLESAEADMLVRTRLVDSFLGLEAPTRRDSQVMKLLVDQKRCDKAYVAELRRRVQTLAWASPLIHAIIADM